MIARAIGILSIAIVAGCSGPSADPVRNDAGSRLEAAATAAGLIADPHASITGSWARDTDRVCVVPAGAAGRAGDARIGAMVDYGEGQGCAASGSVSRSGETLRVTFGACRFKAKFDGERIVFPAELPDACETLCTGRASLAALAVDRLSESASEATTLRTPGGRLLCAS